MELYVYLPSYLFGHLFFLPQLVLAVGWCRQEIYILLQLLKKCFGLIEISANEENEIIYCILPILERPNYYMTICTLVDKTRCR